MKRILLFIATNVAVLGLLTAIPYTVQALLGIRVPAQGMAGLRVAAVFGFGGALISLALSKQTTALRI